MSETNETKEHSCENCERVEQLEKELYELKKQFHELQHNEFGQRGLAKHVRLVNLITSNRYRNIYMLKSIHIRDSQDFKDFQLFPYLPNLKELSINLYMYIDFNKHFPELPNLEKLTAQTAPNIGSMLFLKKFPKLKYYAGCNVFDTFKSLPDIPTLEELHIGKFSKSFKHFPSYQNLKKMSMVTDAPLNFEHFPILPKLEELDLRTVEHLSFEHFDITKLPSIKVISVHESVKGNPVEFHEPPPKRSFFMRLCA